MVAGASLVDKRHQGSSGCSLSVAWASFSFVQCHTRKYVLICVHHIADTYLNKYVHIISPSKQVYINTYLLAEPAQASRPYMLAKLVPAQRAGLHACKAGTSPASRPTCSPSWYQPSKQAYLLAKLVPAQQAGLPARRAGTSPASRCSS
jgi:hypothetical protein